VQIAPGPVAIEVELQRKTARRLRGILAMYARLSDDDGPLAGVIYVTDSTDVAQLVARVADDVGLWNPAISFRTIRDVKAQTYAAARARAADNWTDATAMMATAVEPPRPRCQRHAAAAIER